MIRYAIIDDEPIAHSIIEEFAKEMNSLKKLGNCYDAFQAIDLLQKEEVDLLFLDINMPKITGFEMLKTLKNPPKVIVTTAYKEFALKGYEFQVSDYLLKPFTFSRFLKAVNTVLEFKEPNSPRNFTSEDFIIIKVDKKNYRVKLPDIQFIEAQGNYCKVVTKTNKLLTLRGISDFQTALPEHFMRVHNSYIVNKDMVTAIEGNRIFINEETIPVGRTYKRTLGKL
ncbi:LytR/AlgR family response regulator transcription factor [Altibacter sp. HG106]|uniref:LytR/AlgR family response regulator transcription factor n=1 Tax=Altibacter sp. HG106 TaxID=3023937 RepID=UPI00234FD4BF|nr:LytTR family DNA-binding domain-containing protein [Altibacter sp. HG106]MDC7995628.1 LytTR family DNA-binding domain-containing protein [Altibacter sp. HG106]